jgi:poly(3-hydroxybutyrate) depolymerase
VLAPQAPEKSKSGKTVSTWQAGADDVFLHSLLDHIEKTAEIDRQRIALVGYSAGAAMAVHMAMSNPGRFSACAAVGGGAGMSGSVKPGFTHYFFLAGEKDRGFAPDQARGITERFVAAGGRARYDVVPGVDHAALYAKVEPAAAWLARELSLVTGPTIEP